MRATPREAAALAELERKSLVTIQCETAETWAYRAWAAKRLSEERPHEALRWAGDAVEYEHEAIEHAALSGDDRVLALVRSIVR